MPEILADDGVRLAYTRHGDANARAVVLLAGFTAPATSWRYQIDPLVAAGFQVFAVDLRGHGDADRPESGVDMDRRGLDVDTVLAALDLNDVVLIGGSMGGNTIWSYLTRFGDDRVRAIVIVDQTPKMLNTADWTHGFYGFDESNRDSYFAERIPDTKMGTPLWRRGRRLVRLLSAMKGGGKPLTAGELALLGDHAQRDWRGAIAATEVPVLFVAGADSEFWPASHAAASADLAPRGHSLVIANDGHAANIEQPQAFNRAVVDFIGQS